MANYTNFNLKNSLLALMATASVGGLTLGVAQQAQSAFSSNNHSEGVQTETTLVAAALTQLSATAKSGTPQSFTEQQWKNAKANVAITDVNNDTYTVQVEASGLVPNELYTVWWIKDQLIGKAMGPAGGVENNAFRADSEGNATITVQVPANNDYDMMGVAYHADDQTHGDKPGKIGETAFRHLMGKFVKPNN
ncbi:MAG: hypothetical protein BRC33_12680 [Cyanobacteria bacterium SW_9_44_58]|nr:MAG: hypothetical protein BRC33_12680 [Cyanobacteria bacterium SW_9_44_58]